MMPWLAGVLAALGLVAGATYFLVFVVREREIVVLDSAVRGTFSRVLDAPGLHVRAPWERARRFEWELPRAGGRTQRRHGYRLSTSLDTLDIPAVLVSSADHVQLQLLAVLLYQVADGRALAVHPARHGGRGANLFALLAADTQQALELCAARLPFERLVLLAELNRDVHARLAERMRGYGLRLEAVHCALHELPLRAEAGGAAISGTGDETGVAALTRAERLRADATAGARAAAPPATLSDPSGNPAGDAAARLAGGSAVRQRPEHARAART